MTPNQRGDLGQYLWDLRKAKGWNLRETEEKSGVSNAYISQIETKKIPKPSPAILSKLAEAYDAPYETLMRLAGHIKPQENSPTRSGRLPTFAKEELTEEEEEELLKYLGYIRNRNGDP
jgi:transcriptional regulator with XRE-family HTH domain